MDDINKVSVLEMEISNATTSQLSTSWMKGYFNRLGVYGYGNVEPVVIASLVSGDPLLLIGKSGTGKTFLLNSIAEALGLEHRHYNASMVSFDDLVGFPIPDREEEQVKFLQTPATIWGAGSVLVDELNRCRPEHQNRFFSLVHERRIQGIPLQSLQFRWAAMNPPDTDYAGCQPLDYALADRFAFLINVLDWDELSEGEQRLVAHTCEDTLLSADDSGLADLLKACRTRFEKLLHNPDPFVITYCTSMASNLGHAGLRISPRRVRQWVRNVLAVFSLYDNLDSVDWEPLVWMAIRWSIPQRAGNESPEEAILRSAHRKAWGACGKDFRELWLNDLMKETFSEQISRILSAPNPDMGTAAINLLLREYGPIRRAIMALTLFPALLHCKEQVVGAEGLNDLGLLAVRFFHCEGEHRFYDDAPPHAGLAEGTDPILAAAQLLPLPGRKRRHRLIHLLKCLLLDKVELSRDYLAGIEMELQSAYGVCCKFLTTKKLI